MRKTSNKPSYNENSQDTSLSSSNGKDRDIDKIQNSANDVAKIVADNMNDVTNKRQNRVNTDSIACFILPHESNCFQKKEITSESLTSGKKMMKKLKYSKRSDNRRSLKKLKTNIQNQNLFRSKSNVRNHFNEYNLVNIILRCLQFSQNSKLTLNSFKNKPKNRKTRRVSYKIGIVTILKRRRRIKNKIMRRKKQKATLCRQIEKNKSHTIKNVCNTMISQSKNCIGVNKDDISRNLQINCKNITNNCGSDKSNKEKHLTKHKYTMEKSYQGIKKFLKCYSSYINGMSDSKKKYKIRKYQTKIKLRRRNKKVKSEVDTQNGINRRDKCIKRNYGIFAYLLYRFKVTFCKYSLKKKLESDLAIPLKTDDNERRNHSQELLVSIKGFNINPLFYGVRTNHYKCE